MLDDYKEPPSEVIAAIEPRLRTLPRGLDSKRHRDFMESIYKEYVDSMGKITQERVQPLFAILDEGEKLWQADMDKIKNEEL